MPGDYDKPITVKAAVDAIDAGDFLLPAIQRNFVWNTNQICVLFDSLMRGYPINSFMMWDVKSAEIKSEYRFYKFLEEFQQRFKEENAHRVTEGYKDFKAVIDGQQRLTSIYIGLKGTYAYKQPRVWWPASYDEKILPPRRLYIDLHQPLQDDENESLMQHNFRFLTKDQFVQSLGKSDVHWFELRQALSLPNATTTDEILIQVVLPYLQQNGLESNGYALKTLNRLYTVLHREKVIHYYTETHQDIDHVLDVFIRTNSGGTPLAFSDLLMSIAIASWEGDARKDIDNLVSLVRQSSDMGFSIGRDWVLKTCLMLTGADVRFKVKNFNDGQVRAIEENWSKIRDCIVAAFRVIRLHGLNDQGLRAKNAVIPIAYYLFKQQAYGKPLYETITNLAYHREERAEIVRWLHMVLLKGVFGGQGDGLLTRMRKIFDAQLSLGTFPLAQIIDAFKSTNKDLRFDGEYLHSLLQTQYGEPTCRSVLGLMFPEINENQVLHIDHLHPKASFNKDRLATRTVLAQDSDLMAFYVNPLHWNAIPNLHLLNSSQNTSKKDAPLGPWINDTKNGFRKEDLLLADDISLEFDNFKDFFQARHKALLGRLRSRLFFSDQSLAAEPIVKGDDDKEEAA